MRQLTEFSFRETSLPLRKNTSEEELMESLPKELLKSEGGCAETQGAKQKAVFFKDFLEKRDS